MWSLEIHKNNQKIARRFFEDSKVSIGRYEEIGLKIFKDSAIKSQNWSAGRYEECLIDRLSLLCKSEKEIWEVRNRPELSEAY